MTEREKLAVICGAMRAVGLTIIPDAIESLGVSWFDGEKTEELAEEGAMVCVGIFNARQREEIPKS